MILAFSQPKRVCDFLKFCRIYADVGLALLTASALTNRRRLHSTSAPITGRLKAQSNVSLPTLRIENAAIFAYNDTNHQPSAATDLFELNGYFF